MWWGWELIHLTYKLSVVYLVMIQSSSWCLASTEAIQIDQSTCIYSTYFFDVWLYRCLLSSLAPFHLSFRRSLNFIFRTSLIWHDTHFNLSSLDIAWLLLTIVTYSNLFNMTGLDNLPVPQELVSALWSSHNWMLWSMMNPCYVESRLWHFSELCHEGGRMRCLLTTCECSLVRFKLAVIAWSWIYSHEYHADLRDHHWRHPGLGFDNTRHNYFSPILLTLHYVSC